MIVLVDRKTDGFQDEINPDIKKFAWNGKGKRREIKGLVLTYFLISRLISSWNLSVFCEQVLSIIFRSALPLTAKEPWKKLEHNVLFRYFGYQFLTTTELISQQGKTVSSF